MSLTRRRALALATAFAGSSALPARAQQNWPQRSLRILVGTSPGGSPDIIGRLLADKLADRLGQSDHGREQHRRRRRHCRQHGVERAAGRQHHDAADGGLCQRRRGRKISVRRRQHLRLPQHGLRLSVHLPGAEGFADPVVPRHAGARQSQPGQAHLCHHLARLDLSPDRLLGRQQGRRRHGAGALSRLGRCGDRCDGRPRRRHARHRDLGLSRASPTASSARWR